MSDTSQYTLEDTQISAPRETLPVSCSRLIGVAGSGKTYQLAARVTADSTYGMLTATTGIAAVNLGLDAITFHSALKISGNPLSMYDAFVTGRLSQVLLSIGLRYRRFIVEEYSMLHATQLQFLYRAVQEANTRKEMKQPLGILLVGDLAQLPPVDGEWCFEADCWPRFADSTERLDKVWRQDGGPFLDALNHLRAGRGAPAAELLSSAGARWNTQLDPDFLGTTILPKNKMVTRHNDLRLDEVPGPRISVASRRWGKQQSEWGENSYTHEWGIPPRQDFKIGALVMILANRPDFSVVNGDGGIIEQYDAEKGIFHVRLKRTGAIAEVRRIVRGVESTDPPADWDESANDVPVIEDQDGVRWHAENHRRRIARRYVSGQVEYFPMRLAWATSVHKSQALTLDSVQIDFRDRFFSSPAMLYVAMSRCRTLAGLRLVGGRDRFIMQCKTDERVLPWI